MDANWLETPRWGTCITCGSSANPDGFVDLISEVNIRREDHTISGTVDIVMCADCITQAARQVGCIPEEEAVELAEKYTKVVDELGKTADEVTSWQQRYENIVEIMSMVQLSGSIEHDASGDNPSVGLSTSGPSPDTRVQEGRDIPNKSNGTPKRKR